METCAADEALAIAACFRRGVAEVEVEWLGIGKGAVLDWGEACPFTDALPCVVLVELAGGKRMSELPDEGWVVEGTAGEDAWI